MALPSLEIRHPNLSLLSSYHSDVLKGSLLKGFDLALISNFAFRNCYCPKSKQENQLLTKEFEDEEG